MILRVFLLSFLALAFLACSKDDNSTNNGNSNVNGTMSAKVNGTDWSANYVLTGSHTSSLLAITADQVSGGRDKKMQFNLAGVTGTGTYTFGGFTPNTGIYIDIPQGTTDAATITQNSETAVSGSVIVSELSSSKAKGTFSFTTTRGTSITNGTFDVTLK